MQLQVRYEDIFTKNNLRKNCLILSIYHRIKLDVNDIKISFRLQ